MKQIYLDYSAATPLDPAVHAAMQPYFTKFFFNPSSPYVAAGAVRRDIDRSRAEVAHLLGARPREIVFTAGGTEANNLAIHGIMRRYPGKKLVVSSIEHESVLAPAAQYRAVKSPVTSDGVTEVTKLSSLIDDDTVLLSVMYANNEIGTIQPIADIAAAVSRVRESRRQKGSSVPLYLHTDAAQAANYLDVHVSRLGIDLMTLNGGKIYGPKQSGVLYVRSQVSLEPIIEGGGQEANLRSGTENVPGIIGFSRALAIAQASRQEESRRLRQLQKLFLDLLRASVPKAGINGSLKKRLPNNVHITLPGQDNERLLMGLDELGILAAAGSACSASSEEPSHVLRAMGVSQANAQSSLRFTMGRGTSENDIRRTVAALVRLVT